MNDTPAITLEDKIELIKNSFDPESGMYAGSEGVDALTLDEKRALIRSAYEKYIRTDPVIEKYTCVTGYHSGSTYVAPVGLWVNDGDIVICMSTSRNVFRKRIAKIVRKAGGLIAYGRMSKSDGSCPDTLLFRMCWSWIVQATCVRQHS